MDTKQSPITRALEPISFVEGLWLAMEADGIIGTGSRTYEFAKALEGMIKGRDARLFDLLLAILNDGREMALAKWRNDPEAT